jgi:hypothetical protein
MVIAKEGRKEGRNRQPAAARAVGASLLMLLAAESAAQGGTWGTPFNHETITTGPVVPNPNATDHLIPFGGHQSTGISYYSALVGGIPVVADWSAFNAVHMSLVPKGPHRGKVLVWGSTVTWPGGPLNGAPILVRNPALTGPGATASGEYWSCTAWSYVDPSPSPAGPRFSNFLLPIEKISPPPGSTAPGGGSLFCAGHAWSPFGDLIVAGGTIFTAPLQGPYLTFSFNPNAPFAGWPGGGSSLYPGAGLWKPGVDLQSPRFYPTVVVTSRLSRLVGTSPQIAGEVAIVAGGSVDDLSTSTTVNYTWNTYEALVLANGPASTNPAVLNFFTDVFMGLSEWLGPGTPGNPPPVHEDWLEDYPRLHVLSTGEVFFSGYAPRWAKVDHDLAPGAWVRQAAPPWSSTAWQFPRHDGGSVLLPNGGGLVDVVARFGGSDETSYHPAPNGTTATSEVWIKQGAGGAWWPAPSLPNSQPQSAPAGRFLTNALLLPDGSLLVLGGAARLPNGPLVNMLEPLLYKDGAWQMLPPAASPRGYHSSAVLLPDARVLIGGGDSRSFDYEIFSPSYLTLPRPQNLAFSPSVPVDAQTGAHQLNYGVQYTITFDPLPIGVTASRAVLMTPGSTTHHFDMHQRQVSVPFTFPNDVAVLDSGSITMPSSDKLAPRGIYMLFLVTSSGAVSNAMWVVLR